MLQKQVITIPLNVSMDTKSDPYQVLSDKALSLENVRFHKVGKLHKRFALTPLPVTAFNGEFVDLDDFNVLNVISDENYIAARTTDGIYGLSESAQQWFKQSRFSLGLAAETDFIEKTYQDQKGQDCDVTPDGRVKATVFHQSRDISNKSTLLVLEDLQTGLKRSVVIQSGNSNISLQRVIVTNVPEVVVHVFYYDGTNVKRALYDKSLQLVASVSVVSCTDFSQFDVCKDADAVYFARITGSNLELRAYNFSAAQIASASDTVSEIALSTFCAFGMSITREGSYLHVAWIKRAGPGGPYGPTIKGYLPSTLAPALPEYDLPYDLFAKVSICATTSGLAIAYSYGEANDVDCFVDSLSYTTTYTSENIVSMNRVILAGQPCEVSGKVVLPLACSESANFSFCVANATDQYLMGRISPGLASFPRNFSTDYVYMVSKTPLVGDVAYTTLARRYNLSPRDSDEFFSAIGASSLKMDFSNTEGCRSKVGQSIYFTGGMTVEIDRSKAHENGFILNPHIRQVEQNSGTPNPNIADKTFRYIVVYEYIDSFGQITRSAPSPSFEYTASGTAESLTISFNMPLLSLKTSLEDTLEVSAPVAVLYRNTSGGSIFYRIGERILTSNTGGVSSITDASSDATIINNEVLYTTGNILENDPAPIGKFSTSGGGRIFVGGLEQDDEIAYSKVQLFGESVSFSDFLRLRITSGTSADKSRLSALGFMDGKLIVFRQNSIYFIQGDGPNETGGGGSFTEPEPISSDVGCIDPRSVLNTPMGLMFKSRKGIYLLDRGLQTSYIGAGVEDFNGEKIKAAIMSEKFNEARFHTEQGKVLVFNFYSNQWSYFIDQTTIDADSWKSYPVSIVNDTVMAEYENIYDNSSMTFETPWLKLSGLQDFGRIWSLNILGTYKSTHELQVQAFYDYQDSTPDTYTITPLITDTQYQYRIHLRRQKCESVKFIIKDINPVGEAMELSALTMEVGLKSGSFKLAASRTY